LIALNARNSKCPNHLTRIRPSSRSLGSQGGNYQGFWRRSEGQSLIELALMVPILTILVCYAVDFGYLFIVATSLSSAARTSVEYASQGTSSPTQAAQPSASSVSGLTIAGIGLSSASTSTVSVRVCSSAVGTTLPANTAQCTTPATGAGTVSGTLDVDPESPVFQLNRVDVVFTVTPLIPIPVAIFPNPSFHRMVEMRSIQ
jgi:Flp pilus assembly protein TadG